MLKVLDKSGRFATVKPRQVAEVLAAGWQIVGESDEFDPRVLVWWPCACPPPAPTRASSPAPAKRGEED